MADTEAIEKAMTEEGGQATVKDTGSGGTGDAEMVPPVQSLRFLRTSGTENEVPTDSTEPAVPGQVSEESPGDGQGQGPPPQKAGASPVPPVEDLHWQRHQQHLAYLKSLSSEAYRMAVDDTEGLSPAPKSEVDDTTCTPSQKGPELLQCLSVDVKHLFDEKDDFSRETSMVEKHLDEALAAVNEPAATEKQSTASPRPLTTPGRGVRELKTPPSTVENWSQAEDREIWEKLKEQLQSLEDSVGELTRKTMPKPRRGLDLTQSHPWPKDAALGFFQSFHRNTLPVGHMVPMRHVSRETLSEHSSSDVSSSNAKGHSSMASVQSQQYAEQGSMEPEVQRDGRCVQLSCSRSSNSLASAQLPTPCSAKIMAPDVNRTPSVGARTPAISPGRPVVYRQVSTPVALLTPRIASGYPQ